MNLGSQLAARATEISPLMVLAWMTSSSTLPIFDEASGRLASSSISLRNASRHRPSVKAHERSRHYGNHYVAAYRLQHIVACDCPLDALVPGHGLDFGTLEGLAQAYVSRGSAYPRQFACPPEIDITRGSRDPSTGPGHGDTDIAGGGLDVRRLLKVSSPDGTARRAQLGFAYDLPDGYGT